MSSIETVTWDDGEDDVIAGDLSAALAYVTPAQVVVLAAVAPIGPRDRERGTASFTTSLSFRRKLERMRRNPNVALAYHAREHGFAKRSEYVLAQGRASFDSEPSEQVLEGGPGLGAVHGWLEVDADGQPVYAPHTETGFRAPANKTVLLMANGLMAERRLAKARKAQSAQ